MSVFARLLPVLLCISCVAFAAAQPGGGSLEETEARLAAASEELARIKKLSAQSLALDEENRQLAETIETLRSEVDVLRADNQRLQEKLQGSNLLDGALAVLLGVIIALTVPRLSPRRRRSSSWV